MAVKMWNTLRSCLTVMLIHQGLGDIISLQNQADYMKEYQPPMSATDLLMLNLWRPIGSKLHEGDMLLSSAQKKRYSLQPDTSSSAPLVANPWPSNTVKYKIGTPGPSKELVEHAMARWSGGTCVKFKEDKSGTLEIKYGEGCYAQLGYTGSHQVLVLAKDCESEPVLVHLLGHVLGLPHAHSRPDRDKYLYVRAHNGLVDDFMYLNTKDYAACPFNYQSIMMYDTYGLSRSGEAVFLSSFQTDKGLMMSSGIGIQDAFVPDADLAFAKHVLGCSKGKASCAAPPPEPEPCDVDVTTDNSRFQKNALSFNRMDRSRPNNCVWRVEYTGKEKCVRVGFLILFEMTPDPERLLFLFSTGCRYFQVEVFDPVFEASHFYCGADFVRKPDKAFMSGGVHPVRGTSKALYAFARFRATTGPVTWQYKEATGDLGKTGKVYAFTMEDVYCSDKISPVAPCF
ncbi:dorsal-ventral patterning tolloid-like protein 1 [Pollicipes pollicipes]|uniref:dorsal-ventral patterning tolloid-like protein 1 n=1 Tax=Pollicipes pollicipes TaxID=41117 RepID=UPI001884E3C6|nr:dorsal-ventral patterning tolloid-like protein 1 [Pollicipes pollicipes]XP_037072476.1 dorsal-ventral patterning tolloid-like protein 1 [Pollicipes pollicipes]